MNHEVVQSCYAAKVENVYILCGKFIPDTLCKILSVSYLETYRLM